MKIKIKKQNQDGFVRLETLGEIKEILINEDFFNPKDASIAICFRGKNSSGIVEVSPKELEDLNKFVMPKLHLVKSAKVLKFKK